MEFWAGTAVAGMTLLAYGMASVQIAIVFFLAEARGFGPLEVGAIISGFPLAMVLVSPLAGQFSGWFGPRAISTIGLLIVAGGLVSLSTISIQTEVASIVLRLVIVGIGRGLVEPTNITVMMGSVTSDRIGTASASTNTSRAIGLGIGFAAAGALINELELALLVAAGMALLGAVTSWLSMTNWGRANTV